MSEVNQQNNNASIEEVINLNSPLNFNNFNPEDIDMGETVNVTLCQLFFL